VLLPPRRVAVLGLGLVGGSLLRRLGTLPIRRPAARDGGTEVLGYDRDPATRALARAAALPAGPADGAGGSAGDTGPRWRVAGSVAEVVDAAPDLVVLAVPVDALGGLLGEVRSAAYDGVVTDVTSVKEPVHALVRQRWPGCRFVGGHPMAGTEHSGFAAGHAGLFDGCAWVLSLEPDTAVGDWLQVAALVTALGARVVPAAAAEHDAAVARVSHLPHLVAAALAEGAASGAAGPLALALAAGSFRDGTRVAATRPALTAAMCAAGGGALRAELDAFAARLSRAREHLDGPDPVRGLEGWLTAGHAVRTAWPPGPGARAEVPAEAAALLALGRAGGWVTAVADNGRTVSAVTPA